MTRTMGAVLAGGRSSRFGSDKGAALFDGMTLANHATAAIAPFVEAVIRVGGAGGIADVPASGLGPLGGIAAALDHAARSGFDSVLTIACDMPRLPGGLIEALLVRAPAYCAGAPVLGHWPVSALDRLFALLTETMILTPFVPSDVEKPCSAEIGRISTSLDTNGGKGAPVNFKVGPSIRSWARTIGAIPIESPQPIANVNTPADLLAL
ncbi:molybdenum cofactor guanylyltransferase [Sphingomonas bacterium]|uniref:molybdenum cofactor guanylyltransferase n=1 Tax=Sphingomonas bacterium TaxID=1895847 RepID=UPI0020C6D758|nr:molybdenum cofactor guanylyltransferase [Sphingomonas bacterium]